MSEELEARTPLDALAVPLREQPDESSVSLAFNYLREDFVTGFRYHMVFTARQQWLFASLMVIYGAMAVLLAFLGMSGAWILLVVPPFLWWLQATKVRRAAARLYDREAVARDRTTWYFDERGTESRVSNSWSTSEWSRYRKAIEGPEAFLLYSQENLFYVIPKRVFESPEQMERLRALLRAHLPFEEH